MTGSEGLSATAGLRNDVTIAGGQILGDEYTDHVVKVSKLLITYVKTLDLISFHVDAQRCHIARRVSDDHAVFPSRLNFCPRTLLKSDQWSNEPDETPETLRGAKNFRNIPGTSIYALGQPSIGAIDEVLQRVREERPDADQVCWITLREEPVIYINGSPYCLRRESFTLRNMKGTGLFSFLPGSPVLSSSVDYGGISASRLEVLEERLRDDVIAELDKFGGRVLLHNETRDGAIIPLWEDVQARSVEVMREIMAIREQMNDGTRLYYRRIPITAEKPPDFTDLSDLMEVASHLHSQNTPIILNCQLGRGRSSLTSVCTDKPNCRILLLMHASIQVIVLLIQQWLQADHIRMRPFLTRSPTMVRRSPSRGMQRSNSHHDMSLAQSNSIRHSYQIINSESLRIP